MSDLRAACSHGRYEEHRFEVPDGEWIKWESCPGGREVTIDYEALAVMTPDEMRRYFAGESIDESVIGDTG